MSSLNVSTIGTLVNAITGGLTSGQTYDLMRRISEDLDSVFSSVNSGPLPAVDASALLHINPANIDSPGDVPALVTSQGQVAFLNVSNTFVFDQKISVATNDSLFTSGQEAHFGTATGIDAYIGANLKYKAGAWGSDVGGTGMMLYMANGTASFYQWTGAVLSRAYTIDQNLVHSIGNPSLVNAVIHDLVLQNQKSIRGSNAAVTAALSMIGLDANDLIGLGADAVNTGKGHVAIPQVTAANLPAAGATKDGIIVQDKTNNRFCFYQNGSRYYVLGTAF